MRILFRNEKQIIPTTKTISLGMEEGREIATMSKDKCSYYILKNFLMAEIYFSYVIWADLSIR